MQYIGFSVELFLKNSLRKREEALCWKNRSHGVCQMGEALCTGQLGAALDVIITSVSKTPGNWKQVCGQSRQLGSLVPATSAESFL